MAKTEISAVQSAISTRSRPRRILRVLAFDPQGDFRYFDVRKGHVANFGKPIIGISKISFRVKNVNNTVVDFQSHPRPLTSSNHTSLTLG